MKSIELIKRESDLRPYFKELVEEAVFNQRTEVTDFSQFYVVNLLAEFSSERLEDEPLALMLKNALESEGPEQISSLKRLGDISLFFSGFFVDHLSSKGIDLDYYVAMGEGAYGSLSGILSGDKAFAELYDELSMKFLPLIGIISEVRNSASVFSNIEILRIYERYLKTGDPRLKEMLEREGINTKQTS